MHTNVTKVGNLKCAGVCLGLLVVLLVRRCPHQFIDQLIYNSILFFLTDDQYACTQKVKLSYISTNN